MPVTAKLSRRFYEQLGDDIANELVDLLNTVDARYRSDLDQLNELNFARFDAKLEQRLAEQDSKLDRRFAEQDVKWERRFAELRMETQAGFATLRTDMSTLETDMVRWMFAFWATTLFALASVVLTVLRAR